jgi:hypothetical protein
MPPTDLQYLPDRKSYDIFNLIEPMMISIVVCHERTFSKSVRNCTKDEGRPLGAGLQEQASNHLKLRW